MHAQLYCHGLDDGLLITVPNPAPETWRVVRNDPDGGQSIDEYRRDGVNNLGLIRYVRIERS